MSTSTKRNDFVKIKAFSDLATLVEIRKITEWQEYVEALNDKNPHFINGINHDIAEQLSQEDKDKTFRCYGCYCEFLPHKDPCGNQIPIVADFRYKPHKKNWRSENLCSACFYALQNPKFVWKDCYAYEGILVRYKKSEGWYYRDLRQLDWGEPGWGNPESDDEDGLMNW